MIDLMMVSNFTSNIIRIGFAYTDATMVYNNTSLLDIVVETAYFTITLYAISRLLDKNEV